MDRIDMERMGKKQQLKRNFRSLSIVSFMFLMMGSWLFAIWYALQHWLEQNSG